MSLFDRLFGRAPRPRGETAFQTLTGYSPVFTTTSGQYYESELVRASIDARARHISKLYVQCIGTAQRKLRARLEQAPNNFQTWTQFLYRLDTILDMQNTAFIIPIFDKYEDVVGVYPVLPSLCELCETPNGELWLRYSFGNGKRGAMEFNRCGVMTKFQYRDDFFGENNAALRPTMDLVAIQNQGISEGIKSSATFRFMAKLTNLIKPEDLKKERQRFNEDNFSGGEAGNGGMLLFPNTYADVKQIDSKPFVVDAEQMKVIQTNVYNYFGVNEKILQNAAYGDAWSAFYEGAVEPFAIQLSEVLTRMLFTSEEINRGTKIAVSANRLQYMSNADKLAVSAQMADRGIMTINEIRQIWNLPLLEDGDVRTARGEYYTINDKEKKDDDKG